VETTGRVGILGTSFFFLFFFFFANNDNDALRDDDDDDDDGVVNADANKVLLLLHLTVTSTTSMDKPDNNINKVRLRKCTMFSF